MLAKFPMNTPGVTDLANQNARSNQMNTDECLYTYCQTHTCAYDRCLH